MTAKIFTGGTWRSITRGKVYLGGAWRTITRGAVYKGGAWKYGPTFIPPLTASISPNNTSGTDGSHHPLVITSGMVTLTPAGGLGPYTYSWDGNGTNPTNPTGAATAFSQVVAAFNNLETIATGTVTDSLGSSASATVTVTLTNEGE